MSDNLNLKRSLHFLLLSLFASLNALATTYVVTTNADAGPGSFREALTNAEIDGPNASDVITFNIPSTTVAGRTILIKSILPNLKANLVIDASTQPGKSFGVSDAKVRIVQDYLPNANSSFFFTVQNVNSVQMYALWISSPYPDVSSLNFTYVNNVIIGAYGKGNVIDGACSFLQGDSFKMQNNLMCLDTTGQKPLGDKLININSYTKVQIGSDYNDNPNNLYYGNVIAGRMSISFVKDVNQLEFNQNKLGCNYTATASTPDFGTNSDRLTIQGALLGTQHNLLAADIWYNVIAASSSHLLSLGNFDGTNLSGKIYIDENGFNTDTSGTYNLSAGLSPQSDLNLLLSSPIEIGRTPYRPAGETKPHGNQFAYAKVAVEIANVSTTRINNYTTASMSANSFICITDSLLKYHNFYANNFVTIDKITKNRLEGSGLSSAFIQVYMADCACASIVNPRYFVGQAVNVNTAGKWFYDGPVKGIPVVTSILSYGEYDFNFSLVNPFQIAVSGFSIIDKKLRTTNFSCNNKGALTGITTSATYGYGWYNAQGTLIDTALNISNLLPGDYTFKVDLGGACATSKTYRVKDFTITTDSANVKIVKPGCDTKGSVTGIKLTTESDMVTYTWKNDKGTVVGNTLDLLNVNAGIYTLTYGNSDGTCPNTAGPYNLNPAGIAKINEQGVAITNSTCDNSDGSITGVQVTGPGTYTYQWLNATNQVISTQKDLIKQPAGIYTLAVNNGLCVSAYSSAFEIKALNAITIDDSQIVIKGSLCGSSTGSIMGLAITGTTTYAWKDANNNTVATTADLVNAAPGNYKLYASNAMCSKTSAAYVITPSETIPAPGVRNVKICAAGTAAISAVNTDGKYTYNLYNDNLASAPLQTSKTGTFKVNVNQSATYYLSAVLGSCESKRTALSVQIDPNKVTIPGLITPNGDGINDYLNIKDIESYPAATVNIYNRNGVQVYNYRSSGKPFDGTFNGQQLPNGSYYYIITLGTTCQILSGNITVIR